MSTRWKRRAPLVLALALVIGLLAACRKPVPTVTVFGDGKSIIVDANAYQFSGGPGRTSTDKIPTLTVQAGTSLLVDVPHSVAEHAWFVTAYTIDVDNATKVIDEASSPVITDKHSTRVSTTPVGIGTYLLRVSAFRGSDPKQPNGVWVVQVRTTG